jgi:hypothetical protein
MRREHSFETRQGLTNQDPTSSVTLTCREWGGQVPRHFAEEDPLEAALLQPVSLGVPMP